MSATFRLQRLLVLPVLLATALVVATWVASAPSADAGSRDAEARSTKSDGSRLDGAKSRRVSKIRTATRVALNQRGDPYVYGAAGPNAFDCSGLTYFAYQKVGISLPRSSDAQYRALRHIRKERMHRGDLMFFHSGGSVYHVAIFLGWEDGRRVLLHAPSTGERVNRDQVWTSQWRPGTLRPRRG